jgi:hypothetical protein
MIKLRNDERTQLAFVGVVVILFYVYYLTTRFTKTIHIRKDFGYHSGMGRYMMSSNMVVDEHQNPYNVRNSVLLLHFSAASTMARIEPNKTYHVKGYGLHIPQLGMYPNITQVRPRN